LSKPVLLWREHSHLEPKLIETANEFIYNTTFGTYKISKSTPFILTYIDRYGNNYLQLAFPWLYRYLKKKWTILPFDLIVDYDITATDTHFILKITLYEDSVICYIHYKIEFTKTHPPKISFRLEPTSSWIWNYRWIWIVIPSDECSYLKKEDGECEDIRKEKGKRRFIGEYNKVELGTHENVELWRQWLLSYWHKNLGVYIGEDPCFSKPSVIVYYPTNQKKVDPVVIGTSTIGQALGWNIRRRTFFARKRFWAFWSDGTNMVYASSYDGINWTEPTPVRPCESGLYFSVTTHQDLYVHYVYSVGTVLGDSPLYYRRGVLNLDGTITWYVEQKVREASELFKFRHPSVAIDSNGYPFVFYAEYEDGVGWKARVEKSATNDGTWVTQWRTTLETMPPAPECTILSLTGGKMYAVWACTIFFIHGCLWDGSAWGSIETVTPDTDIEDTRFAVASDGDDVFVAYKFPRLNETYTIRFVKRTYGEGWGSVEVVLKDMEYGTTPGLSNYDGHIYLFWERDDIVYYKRRHKEKGWESESIAWYTEIKTGTPRTVPRAENQTELLDVDSFVETRTGWSRTGASPWLDTPNDGNVISESGIYPVDGFIETRAGWTRIGASPWLDAPDDGNYIYTDVKNDEIGDFTFKDVPGWSTGSSIYLVVYCQQEAGGNDQLEINLFSGTVWTPIATITPNPGAYAYEVFNVTSLLNSQDLLNNAKIYFRKITVGAAQIVYIDYARLVTDTEIGDFTFTDSTIWLAGSKVYLSIYAKRDVGDDELEVHLWDGSLWNIAGTIRPASTFSYKYLNVTELLNTLEKINSAKIYFRKMTIGDPEAIYIDHALLVTSNTIEVIGALGMRGTVSPFDVIYAYLEAEEPIIVPKIRYTNGFVTILT